MARLRHRGLLRSFGVAAARPRCALLHNGWCRVLATPAALLHSGSETSMSYFDPERLDAYRLAVDVAQTVAASRFRRGDADLRDPAVRASRSVALHIAEGRARGGGAAKNHYRMALGSAAETCAALDLARVDGAADLQDKLRRIGAMLRCMAR